jgi:hypothetical protein
MLVASVQGDIYLPFASDAAGEGARATQPT